MSEKQDCIQHLTTVQKCYSAASTLFVALSWPGILEILQAHEDSLRTISVHNPVRPHINLAD